ncbi:hypothetical protein CR513_30507, partial [Mucuna pruriens]
MFSVYNFVDSIEGMSVLNVLNIAPTQLYHNNWGFIWAFELLSEDIGRAPSLGLTPSELKALRKKKAAQPSVAQVAFVAEIPVNPTNTTIPPITSFEVVPSVGDIVANTIYEPIIASPLVEFSQKKAREVIEIPFPSSKEKEKEGPLEGGSVDATSGPSSNWKVVLHGNPNNTSIWSCHFPLAEVVDQHLASPSDLEEVKVFGLPGGFKALEAYAIYSLVLAQTLKCRYGNLGCYAKKMREENSKLKMTLETIEGICKSLISWKTTCDRN